MFNSGTVQVRTVIGDNAPEQVRRKRYTNDNNYIRLTEWAGPRARDDGDSYKCVQLLHFGSKVKQTAAMKFGYLLSAMVSSLFIDPDLNNF